MKSPFERNTMGLIFHFENDGEINLTIGHNFDDDLMQTDEYTYYIDVINGIKVAIENEMDGLANRGLMLRTLYEALSSDEGDVSFEPSDELLEAMDDAKIVHLKDRMN